MDLYDYPDIYDERFTETANNVYREHYRKMFAGRRITDILDCSFGTGCLSFCLCELGYQLYGSDLSETMLKKAREKAEQMGYSVPLLQCDFRTLRQRFDRSFSCVMSTGSSLAHVDRQGIEQALREMDGLVKPGGYLYFDSRNWDREMREKKRFHYGSPFLKEDGTRINYVQVWDYHADDTLSINILQAYERDGRIVRQDVYEEHLHPFSLQTILNTLKELYYEEIVIKPLPYFADKDFEETDWYCLLAKKERQAHIK